VAANRACWASPWCGRKLGSGVAKPMLWSPLLGLLAATNKKRHRFWAFWGIITVLCYFVIFFKKKSDKFLLE
jgi:MFS-type transporter involved in bile tolerance (Atg22 family)